MRFEELPEGSKIFKGCPTVLSYVQHIFPGGEDPVILRLFAGLVT